MRTSRLLLALLASTTIACGGTSEPVGWASSIALRSEVPTGILDSRDASRVLLGERLRSPIVVQVLDPRRRPAPWVHVKATPSHGGRVAAVGSEDDLPTATVVTDATGMAAFWWTPGPSVGDQTLTFSAPGADDVVVHVYAYWPLDTKVKLTLADSVLAIGETTTASVTFTTATGEAIAYDGRVYWWASESRIAMVTGGDSTTGAGGRMIANAKALVTVTAESPGQAVIWAEAPISRGVGSQSGIAGWHSITVPPVCDLAKAARLLPGQTVNGVMTALDCRLETGAPYDHYRLDLAIGQRVQIDLASREFDPYLILLDANGAWVTGDDWSGGGTTARITFTAESPTYYLQATSLAPGIVGRYTLSAKTVP